MHHSVLVLLSLAFIVSCSVSTSDISEPIQNKNESEKTHVEAHQLCQGNKLCQERLSLFMSEQSREPITDAEVCFVYSNIKSDYCDDE